MDGYNHPPFPPLPPFPTYPTFTSSSSDVRRSSHGSDLNTKILITAIVSLSVVLVLVFALHLYARCVLRRQARRRLTAVHQLSLSVAHAHSGEPPNTGLDPTIIASLPIFVFKRKESQNDKDEDDEASGMECAVCLSALEDEEMARLLPNCKHSFHVGCIDTWLASHSTCPICRTKVEPRLEPQAREGPVGVDRAGLGGVAMAPSLQSIEGTSDGASLASPKINDSNSTRLSSFRRILSRERSSRRIQPSSHQIDIDQDLERQ